MNDQTRSVKRKTTNEVLTLTEDQFFKSLSIEKPIIRQIKKFDKLISYWMSILYSEFVWPEREYGDSKLLRIDDDILESLGFDDLVEGDIKETIFRKRIKQNLIGFAQSNLSFKKSLSKNIQKLKDRLSLTNADCMILILAVENYQHTGLNSLLNECKGFSAQQTIRVLAKLFDLPRTDVANSFKANSLLRRIGFLSERKPKFGRHYDLSDQLELIDGLPEELLDPTSTDTGMFERFIIESSKTDLTAKDFDHITEQYKQLSRYIKNVRKENKASANILLYGSPGVGKTELVKVLCEEHEFSLFEVSMRNEDGESINGEARFSAYQLGQRLLESNKNSVVVFDEVEDVFPAMSFFGSSSSAGKSWINKQLEENQTPCFWLTNSIDAIDPAHIRRFDMVIEIKVPPKKKRAEIIKKYTKDIKLSASTISLTAEQKYLSPAVIERSANVTQYISKSAKEQEKCFTELLNESLKAMNLYDVKAAKKTIKPLIPYDVNLANTDKDLKELIKGLKNSPCARLCFYGVPGTGKTALGSHIAKELKMPILVKRASDLLSMYVGGSEKNIARMFEEAEEKKAILILDEADSFLRDRNLANQSWEVTQVNELLTQMEAFEGIFICTTNLMDNLDSASLRRFDLKMKFNYLNEKQSWKLFIQLAKTQKYKASEYKEYRDKIRSMCNLAPGDFALLVRQYRFTEPNDIKQIVCDLDREGRMKNKYVSNYIGFLHQ